MFRIGSYKNAGNLKTDELIVAKFLDNLETGKIDAQNVYMLGAEIKNAGVINTDVICAPNLTTYSGNGEVNAKLLVVTEGLANKMQTLDVENLVFVPYHDKPWDVNDCKTFVAGWIEEHPEFAATAA